MQNPHLGVTGGTSMDSPAYVVCQFCGIFQTCHIFIIECIALNFPATCANISNTYTLSVRSLDYQRRYNLLT